MLKRLPLSRQLAQFAGLTPRPASRRQFVLDLLPKRSVGVEIGVHRGDFSAELLRTVRPRRLHLIDPWRYEADTDYSEAWYGGKASGGQAEMDERHQAVCARFAAEIRSGRVVIHRAESGAVMAGFPENTFDWVYVDGNHYYEFVRQDLALAFERTKPGGHIAGDDYAEAGWWQGGVRRAVDELAASRPGSLVALREGQFVFRKPA
jgi:hypothetical protein